MRAVGDLAASQAVSGARQRRFCRSCSLSRRSRACGPSSGVLRARCTAGIGTLETDAHKAPVTTIPIRFRVGGVEEGDDPRH
jgi:hypothetical protein